ncbi:putative reverse transcriptase zinc-binding domain-containing protein [Helianthus annuus]|nr:putative reverse transcriptase zinc-binding domain-containing protein [Helianthus annuus]
MDFSDRHIMDWRKWVSLKCNIFTWRAELARIPTTDALLRRGIYIEDDACPFVNSTEESVTHIFTGCIISTVLWQKVTSWCRILNWFVFSFRDLLKSYKHCGKSAGEKEALHGDDGPMGCPIYPSRAIITWAQQVKAQMLKLAH